MPKTVDAADEARLVDAVKQAVALVDTGLDPNAAVEKVARQVGLTPGEIRTVSHAYNTGRHASQWEDGRSALDKLATFDLADAQTIIDRVFSPAEKQAAVSADYQQPPTWLERPLRATATEKQAAVQPVVPQHSPEHRLTLALGAVQRQKQANEELRRRAALAEDGVRTQLAHLVGYFKKSAAERRAFADVESAALTYFGPAAQTLLGSAYAQARLREKRAGHMPSVLTTGFDHQREPLTFVSAAIKHAQDAHRARLAYEGGLKKLAEVEEDLRRPFAGAGTPAVEPAAPANAAALIMGVSAEKQAFWSSPAVGSAVGTMLGRSIGSVPKTKDDLIEDAWLDLEDPEHANELRKIKAHAMLNGMLTDPDDPISGHDPDKVLQAYNEISQVAPRAAESAALLRPLLRRRLEGHTESFEAKELVDIEKGVGQSRLPTPNTSILSDAPDKVLG